MELWKCMLFYVKMLSNLWTAYLSINGDVGSTELKRWGEENEKKEEKI